MKIILLQDVRKVGKKNEIKNVSDGYAMNFLIPKGLAKVATGGGIKEVEILNQSKELKEKQNKDFAKQFLVDANNKELIFALKTGKNGEIFSALHAEEIEKEIKKLAKNENFHFKVNLEKPIKKLGEEEVEIDFGGGVKGKIKIIIKGNET